MVTLPLRHGRPLDFVAETFAAGELPERAAFGILKTVAGPRSCALDGDSTPDGQVLVERICRQRREHELLDSRTLGGGGAGFEP